ncbi:MAG: glycogen/starch/alpha-glucan family phosphorylase [Alphaproteobacteria bacterium]|nr:glycogen/starch/alpha-glucan family phosphorylase [Alphaproteobacteria bacterium]
MGPAADARDRDVGAEIVETMIGSVGKHPATATAGDWFQAVALFLRARMAKRWLGTKRMMHRRDVKTVYYLSMEFLIGRSLKTHLLNLGLESTVRGALADLGVDLEEICEQEYDAALGNGGLGRLAACLMDSLTTLGYPACGYGIRYDHGMFAQGIDKGWQVERPEEWLRHGNPWEFARPHARYRIGFGGRVEHHGGAARWVPEREVEATAYDLQVSGFDQDMVNTLRLWSARAANDLDIGHFNTGDHAGAVRDRTDSEMLSRVLYPDDSTEQGRELRLRQEYFFVAASVQDILGRYLETCTGFDLLPRKAAIQLNDTHPALGVAELVRLLVDVHWLPWERACALAREVFAYTNHTLLPEALETWPVGLLGRVLPRHLEIIYRINGDFLDDVARHHPGDTGLLRRVSLVDEDGDRRIRMAHLAFVGSHKVNGVSQLHTDIMRASTFGDFEHLFPGRITCKTNGVSNRRWLSISNPGLGRLLTERIGTDWHVGLAGLSDLAPAAEDAGFRRRFAAVKRMNKERLGAYMQREMGIAVDPDFLFDIQVKRIHEYKRQLLNLLHVVHRYHRIKDGHTQGMVPRAVIFGGKAASSYHRAKLIIKLINDVAATVNADPAAAPWLKVAFIPNYGVSLAETIIPAADLSEQVSTAGAEASGTGNMKFALNGALTIGTWDGANIEIGEAVGEDNVFFFGLKADEVEARRRGDYEPRALYEADPSLARVLDAIASGTFSPEDRDAHRAVADALLDGGDYYMLLADFRAYLDAQAAADAAYRNQDDWWRRSVLNVSGMGRFSSDRTIREYASEIWRVAPYGLTRDASPVAAAG